jgi:hypothetical protein
MVGTVGVRAEANVVASDRSMCHQGEQQQWGRPAMRKRSSMSVLMTVLGAASVAAFGLVAAPSVSQATGSASTSFYLSLGDSYSVGYQPGKGATAGYTTIVATKAKLRLENFGCGGATSGSLLTAIGCTESG